jgi:hypothetical protein
MTLEVNYFLVVYPKLSKIWVWYPGSGKKPIPDLGSKRHRIRNTDHQ